MVAYHKVRQAVAAGFVGIVHCRSEYNLADWDTKMVSGKTHQYLMHHQTYPPTSLRECQTDLTKMTSRGKSANKIPVVNDRTVATSQLILQRNSELDRDVTDALQDKNFVSAVVQHVLLGTSILLE